MKKVLTALVIIVAIFLAIPFIGNKLIESEINNNVEVLTSYGLKLKDSKTDFLYFNTKKYFIFKVDDAEKFITYLNNFSDYQLFESLNPLVDGIELGLDVEYSNFPISDAVSLDIYLNSLPAKIAKSLKVSDAKYYSYLDALLKSKSIGYHINYHVLNKDFNGYLKDIDRSYSSIDGTQFDLKLFGASFSGRGMVMAPEAITSKIKELKFNIKDNKEIDLAVTVDNLVIDFSSNTQGLKDMFYNKINFDYLSFKTFKSSINIDKFNFDAQLHGVPKNTRFTLEELLNGGVVLDVADFSLKGLSTAKTKNLGQVSIQSRLVFKEDKNLVKKIDKSLLNIMELMDIDLAFKMSKNMYSKFSLAYPILRLIKGLSKDSKEFILFDVKLKDSNLNINGQGI